MTASPRSTAASRAALAAAIAVLAFAAALPATASAAVSARENPMSLSPAHTRRTFSAEALVASAVASVPSTFSVSTPAIPPPRM